jgi:hypothetical protein
MRHPDDTVLTGLLTEPAAVTDADRDHVVGCPQCLDRVSVGRPEGGRSAPTTPPRPAPARGLLRRPVVAALAVGVVLAGGATAAATDRISIFRTEQVAPVAFSAADLVAVPDLDAFGDVVVTSDAEPHAVDDAAAAAAATGLEVPRVTRLPRGVGGEPVHQVVGEVAAAFTFSADRAARAAADAGTTLPAPPPGLDGSEVRLVAGPGTAQIWTGAAGTPTLVVGRAVAPSATSTGVELDVARDYLLSLPGLPDDVVAQLRTLSADGSTLPLPVPTDRVTTSTVDVDGAAATLLETRDRAMAAVVWVENGVVTVVAGALGADEVLAVARDVA